MARHALRAVPWWRVLAAAALVVTCMALVRWNPSTFWALEGSAVGLLAGTAAWTMDEDAAALVDTLPRGLGWRTTARAPAWALLGATWTVVCLWAGDDMLFGHATDVLVQGWAALVLGAVGAAAGRIRGAATPGLPIAAGVVPVALGWALVRPFDGRLWIFPSGDDGASVWRGSTVGWLVAGGVGLLALTSRRRNAPRTPKAAAGGDPRAGRRPDAS